MRVIEKLRKENYKVKRGTRQDAKYYDVVIETPNEKIIEITSSLDETIVLTPNLIETTRRELIEATYYPSEDNWAYFEFGCDKKSLDYMKSVAESIGLSSYSSEKYVQLNVIENETTEPFKSIFSKSYLTKVGENYVIQVETQKEIKGITLDTYVFNRKPSGDDFFVAFILENTRELFSSHNINSTFNCWKCGKTIHWLDIPGDFLTKAAFVDDMYCGC